MAWQHAEPVGDRPARCCEVTSEPGCLPACFFAELENETSCCRKPQFQCTQWSSAGQVCQKVYKHCFWHLAGRFCDVARCPAKTGTSFTLRVSGFLMGAILRLGQEMPRNTVLSSLRQHSCSLTS